MNNNVNLLIQQISILMHRTSDMLVDYPDLSSKEIKKISEQVDGYARVLNELSNYMLSLEASNN